VVQAARKIKQPQVKRSRFINSAPEKPAIVVENGKKATAAEIEKAVLPFWRATIQRRTPSR
jgi:hypothetical protein